jgi:hypothetical protein
MQSEENSTGSNHAHGHARGHARGLENKDTGSCKINDSSTSNSQRKRMRDDLSENGGVRNLSESESQRTRLRDEHTEGRSVRAQLQGKECGANDDHGGHFVSRSLRSESESRDCIRMRTESESEDMRMRNESESRDCMGKRCRVTHANQEMLDQVGGGESHV